MYFLVGTISMGTYRISVQRRIMSTKLFHAHQQCFHNWDHLKILLNQNVLSLGISSWICIKLRPWCVHSETEK